MNMTLEAHIPPKDPEVIVKSLTDKDEGALRALAAFETRAFGDEANTIGQLKAAISLGDKFFVLWSGDRVVGVGSVRTTSFPDSFNKIKKNLPAESAFVGHGAVDPDFRGEGLQRILLEKRKEFARDHGKETVIGTVRPENGASFRNIVNAGGRIFAYSPDFLPNSNTPSRFLWEIDMTIPNEVLENIEERDVLAGSVAVEACKRGDQKIVLLVQSGEDRDPEAEEAAAQILSGDYIGTNTQTVFTGTTGVRFIGVLFRSLSSFPPEVQKRLRERKKVIQDILLKSENPVS